MTKLFILLAVLLLSQISFSQSIVDTNKVWSYIFEDTSAPWTHYTNVYKFGKLVTINSKEYRKVLLSTDPNQAIWDSIGIAREDSNRVYYNGNLIIDFNLNLHDTVELYSSDAYSNPVSYMIETIDSLLIGNTYRMRYILNNLDSNSWSNNCESWIKGVGCMSSFLGNSSCTLVGLTKGLICFTENDTIKYNDTHYDSCYYYTDIKTESIDNNIRTYPNPASTFLQVESENLKVESCAIFDVYGRELANPDRFLKPVRIDINNLPKGLYFIKLQTNKGIVVKKFVKQ